MNLLEKIQSIFGHPVNGKSHDADKIIAGVVAKTNTTTKEIYKINKKIEKDQTYFILKAMGYKL